MGATSGIVLVFLPALLVIEAATAILVCWQNDGALYRLAGNGTSPRMKRLCIGGMVGAWLALTAISWWCLFLGAYMAMHVFYFSFGVIGGWTALVGAAGMLVAIPLIWGKVLLGLARREFGHGSARPPGRILPG